MNSTATEIVRITAHWIDQGVRVDTRTLAAELGISRSTLFRRVGNREDLLGETFWYMGQSTMERANRAWERKHGDAVRSPEGELRCLEVMRMYRESIAGNNGFRQFLHEEPAIAMRVLTDPRGKVQPRVIAAHVELLRRDVEAGGFVPSVSLDSLSYAIVRLGEAFLYSDVVAARAPDLDAATTLLAALVEGHVPATDLPVG